MHKFITMGIIIITIIIIIVITIIIMYHMNHLT